MVGAPGTSTFGMIWGKPKHPAQILSFVRSWVRRVWEGVSDDTASLSESKVKSSKSRRLCEIRNKNVWRGGNAAALNTGGLKAEPMQ